MIPAQNAAIKAQPQSVQRNGHGCWFYGCTAVAVIAVLLIAGGIYGGYRVYTWARDTFTSTERLVFPQPSIAGSDLEALKLRFERFTAALKDGTASDPLVLTGEEINALVAAGGQTNFVGGLHVSIDNDKLVGQLSMPADEILPIFSGRYLNLTARIDASIENGLPIVLMDEVLANGKPLPEIMSEGFRGLNLAQGLYEDPEAMAKIRKIDSLKVNGDRLVVTPATGN